VTHERRLHGESSEQAEADADRGDPVETPPANERIGVGGGDEIVAKLQLSARWAEQYGPNSGDTMDEVLARFRRAYRYIDSVTKLIEPEAD
jgi:hypothetical protein